MEITEANIVRRIQAIPDKMTAILTMFEYSLSYPLDITSINWPFTNFTAREAAMVWIYLVLGYTILGIMAERVCNVVFT